MRCPRVALVGAGRMGARHARVIAASDRCCLALIVDPDVTRAQRLAAHWNANWSADLHEALEMDAAVVSSSTSSHFDVARALISTGTPLLVEKPLTLDVTQTRELVRAAEARDVVLMCGFVERFNASLLQLFDRCAPVRTQHVHMVRVGPSPHATDSSVVEDILLHDLDLLLRHCPDDVVVDMHVEGSDWSPAQSRPESVRCDLTLASGTTATLNASRVSSLRERTITITSHDGRSEHADLLVGQGDPLVTQFAHFMSLVVGTSSERDAERRTLLPGHEVAHLVAVQLQTLSLHTATRLPDRPGTHG